MEPTRAEQWPTASDGEGGVVRGCRVETTTVRSLLWAATRPRLAWADGTTAVGAGGATATIAVDSRNRFETVRKQGDRLFEKLTQVEDLPPVARPRLYGGFSFTDTHGENSTDTWAGFRGAEFVLPAIQLAVTDDGAWLTATDLGPDARETATRRLTAWRQRLDALPAIRPSPPAGVRELTYTPDRATWRAQVENAIERIDRGDLQKVVLAQSLSAELEGRVNAPDILSRLGEQYPDCYRFLFAPVGGSAFFGASPERLVTVAGRSVETEALAGSIGRGETPADDERLARTLLESPKNSHEHDLVVEAIRDQLGAMDAHSRTGERTVRRLATLQHLQTPIRAELPADEHVLSLVEALHPTPAVGGLPPDDALDTIRELETFDRGWYAAPVGWFDEAGDGTFAVAIRSGLADGETATLFAGAGIVPDSDPNGEWDELQLKYRPILDELR